MKREYPDVPLVGIGAIIIERDRVVLVKRGQAPLQGQWSIPGGMLEVGETLREAAVREVADGACHAYADPKNSTRREADAALNGVPSEGGRHPDTSVLLTHPR